MMHSEPFLRLKQQIVARTGHHYYVDKDKLLLDRVRERMQALGVASIEAYLDQLGLDEEAEWRSLEDTVTVGETYFFRYPEQFDALRKDILPKLIEARRNDKALRIWSIGCANGSEPYSLAIVLRELLGDGLDAWRIALIGGDISDKALEAARAGRYGDWALRTMGPADRAKYFERDARLWRIKPEYRRMVRFERQNLLALLSKTPPLEWSGFDLILCRNVLIYFSPAQAIEIAGALRQRLAGDGFLLLGHAEASFLTNLDLSVSPQLPTEFGMALRPSSPETSDAPPEIPPAPAPQLHPSTAPMVATAAAASDVDEVRSLADAGAYEEAIALCQALIKRAPTSARLQYYDAVLRQVSDDLEGAEAALRRALYLDRSFLLAHHRLGLLMLGLGRKAEARRSLLAAMRLAEALPAAEAPPESPGVSAGEISTALRHQINALGEAS